MCTSLKVKYIFILVSFISVQKHSPLHEIKPKNIRGVNSSYLQAFSSQDWAKSYIRKISITLRYISIWLKCLSQKKKSKLCYSSKYIYLNIYLALYLLVFEFFNIFNSLKYMPFLTNTNMKFKIRFIILYYSILGHFLHSNEIKYTCAWQIGRRSMENCISCLPISGIKR